MTNNDTAGCGNISKYIRLELTQNKKAILIGISGIWIFYIFIGMLLGYNYSGGGKTEIIFFSIIAQIITSLMASFAFSIMKNKDTRIYHLMIPASIKTKFLTRWTAFIPLSFLVLLAGIYLGDFARILTFAATTYNAWNYTNYTKVIDIWNFYLLNGDPDGNLVFCLAFGSFFLSQSMYFFGAILWPKLSFIKSFAAIYVVQTITGLLLMLIKSIFKIHITSDYMKELLWCIFGIMVAVTLLLYFLSYLKYRRSQVVYKLF